MLSIYDYMRIPYCFYHGRQGRRVFLFLGETAREAFSSIFLMETHQISAVPVIRDVRIDKITKKANLLLLESVV